MTQCGFHLGGAEAEFVDVRVLSPRESVSSEGWLDSDVLISAGAFRAAFRAAFESEDFRRFEAELRSLWKTLAGQATFEPSEGQLILKVVGDGRGGVAITGEACELATRNRLTFELTIDQTYLESVLRELEATLAAAAESRSLG